MGSQFRVHGRQQSQVLQNTTLHTTFCPVMLALHKEHLQEPPRPFSSIPPPPLCENDTPVRTTGGVFPAPFAETKPATLFPQLLEPWNFGGSIFLSSMKIKFFIDLGLVFWGCWFLSCHLLPLPCSSLAPFCSLLHLQTMVQGRCKNRCPQFE